MLISACKMWRRNCFGAQSDQVKHFDATGMPHKLLFRVFGTEIFWWWLRYVGEIQFELQLRDYVDPKEEVQRGLAVQCRYFRNAPPFA